MNQFCEKKGILRQFSIARTPQQNRVAKRRNRTLIEAARTMLADFKLPTTFWAEAVNNACYVQNRVLVVKPHNKTPYELFHGRTPNLSFMRPFGCPVTILNTIDHLGKFDSKADEGFFVRYSLNSKAFRVFNSKTRIVEENLCNISHFQLTVGGKTSIELPFDLNMPALEDYSIFDFFRNDEDDGAMTNMNNLDTTIQVSPIPTTRIHKDHHLDQVIRDLQLGFEDPDFPDRVYKVKKALYGLHQAPRAWYETLSTYLLNNGFQRGKIDKTLFIKRHKGDILLMSSMGELIFFLGLQVKQKKDDIFISQDKYVDEILKKFGFIEVKTASTPMETQKPLLKDEDGEEVDVHMYRSMIGSLMYLTSSRPDIMFAVCACARYQVNPKVSHLHAHQEVGCFRFVCTETPLRVVIAFTSPFGLAMVLLGREPEPEVEAPLTHHVPEELEPGKTELGKLVVD
ncbi:uncharacterized mitochondrial protein-like protein [Tanacetum coccineum]